MCTNCNDCKYVSIHTIGGKSINRYNAICTFGDKYKVIDLSVKESEKLLPPNWCPIKDEETEKKGDSTEMSFNERMEALGNIPRKIEWDDIKEREIYHVPQLLNEERKDIFILYRNSSFCTYRIVGGTTAVQTMYPNSLIAKAMVPHKIIQFEMKTK